MLEHEGGRLGVTFAPGKKARSAYGPPWSRDLDLDLSRMRQALGVEVLVPLVEDEELEQVWSGKKSAKEALDAIVTRGNELLARFEKSYKK